MWVHYHSDLLPRSLAPSHFLENTYTYIFQDVAQLKLRHILENMSITLLT